MTVLAAISQVSTSGHSEFLLLLPVITHTPSHASLLFPWQSSPERYEEFTESRYIVRFPLRNISPVATPQTVLGGVAEWASLGFSILITAVNPPAGVQLCGRGAP